MKYDIQHYDVTDENGVKIGKINKIYLDKNNNLKSEISIYNEGIIKKVVLGRHDGLFSVGYKDVTNELTEVEVGDE